MSLGRIAGFLGDICACFDLFTPSYIFHSLPCPGVLPAREFSNRVRFMGNQGVNRCTPATTSSTSAIHIHEDVSYLADQTVPSALTTSSSGPAVSVPSFRNVVQVLPGTTDVHPTVSRSRSLLDLASLSISCPSHPFLSPSGSDSGSGSGSNSIFLEVTGNIPLLCEESLASLAGDDDSFC
jgi:hypothetical protein